MNQMREIPVDSNTSTHRPPAVEVRGLAKHYGSVVALRDVNLTVTAGEYFVLLGPSGGGKTTLLRTIGGFHKPTKGSVLLHGQDVSHLPPDKRPTSMVFQSYATSCYWMNHWPHSMRSCARTCVSSSSICRKKLALPSFT